MKLKPQAVAQAEIAEANLQLAKEAQAQAEEARQIAEEKTKEAQQQRDMALELAYVLDLRAARAALNQVTMTSFHRRMANARKAKEIQIRMRLSLAGEHDQLEEDFGSGGSLDHLPFEWQYLNARIDESFATLRGHEYSGSYQSPSAPMAPAWRREVTNNTIRLWDAETGEELATLRWA